MIEWNGKLYASYTEAFTEEQARKLPDLAADVAAMIGR